RRGWVAGIKINGKRIHLGDFKNEEDAARAYDEASQEHHGEYGCTNPDCECTDIYVGIEPYICDACDAEFILGNRDEVWTKMCYKCKHYPHKSQLKIPETCLTCNKQSNFQSKRKNKNDQN
ncbi:unnamed protein product, partial [marine sediment metagenome]